MHAAHARVYSCGPLRSRDASDGLAGNPLPPPADEATRADLAVKRSTVTTFWWGFRTLFKVRARACFQTRRAAARGRSVLLREGLARPPLSHAPSQPADLPADASHRVCAHQLLSFFPAVPHPQELPQPRVPGPPRGRQAHLQARRCSSRARCCVGWRWAGVGLALGCTGLRRSAAAPRKRRA